MAHSKPSRTDLNLSSSPPPIQRSNQTNQDRRMESPSTVVSERKTMYAGQDMGGGPSLIMRDIINFGTSFICLGVAGYIFFMENGDPFRHMVGGAVFGTVLLVGAFRTWTCPCPYDTNDDQILIAGAGIMLGYFLVHWLRCCKAQMYSLIFVGVGLFQILRTISKTFGIIPCNW